jgi:hypothetical protein
MDSGKQQAKKEKEEELLSELVYSKLEAAWNDVKFMKKLSTRLSELESDKLVLGCLFAFAVEQGIEFGQTKEEFFDTVSAVYDDVSSGDDDDDDDGDEEDEEEDNVVDLATAIVAEQEAPHYSAEEPDDGPVHTEEE